MTAEQLEELLAHYDGDIRGLVAFPLDDIRYLARRVIAAEKLVEALRPVINSHWNESHIRGMHGLERALSTYEASK